jgi:hypothetical protein
MNENNLTGSWSIPDGKSYPGQLCIDHKTGNITLEIYGTDYINGVEIDLNNDILGKRRVGYFNYLWGNSTPYGRITLVGCNWRALSHIGNELFSIKYDAAFLLSGIHITAKSDFLIKSGRFSFPYLGSFYAGFNHVSMSNRETELQNIEQVSEHILQVTEELKLSFNTVISRTILEFTVSSKTEINDFLTFQYLVEVPFSRLMADAFRFRKLLEFSYGEPLTHQIHSVEIHDSQLAPHLGEKLNKDGVGYYVTSFTLSENKKIERGLHNQNHMLLSNWQLSTESLDNVIIKWYQNGHLNNIYDYYLDSNNWFQGIKEVKLSNVMFNNRFLNLIQGLEDYYREFLESGKTALDRQEFEDKKKKVLSHIKQAELKKWLNNTFKAPQYASLEEKLTTIVGECLPVINAVFQSLDWTVFPVSAKDFRNKLSHGMNKNTNLGQGLTLDYHIAQLLLCICILKSLEIPYIVNLIKTNYKMQETVGTIRRLQKSI